MKDRASQNNAPQVNLQACEVLLNWGASATIADARGMNLLHYAASQNLHTVP